MCECVALHPCTDGEEEDQDGENEGNDDDDENWEADPNGAVEESEKPETMDDLPAGESGPNGK